jgi:thioredoxin-like negative regulator of GroEL
LAELDGTRGDVARARTSLGAVVEESQRRGLATLEYDARLSLARLELVHGDATAARRLLATLASEAEQKGLHLVARQAKGSAKS